MIASLASPRGRWLALVIILFQAVSTFSLRADPFAQPAIAEVIQRHELGVKGDKKVVQDLIADLEKQTKVEPVNQLLVAYLGSAYTLRSRDLFPGPSKLKFLKLGLQTMDQAVEAAPNNVAVRFIRAINNYQLPSFIGRRDNARSDFQALLQAIEKPEVKADLNHDTLQAIYYYAGLTYVQLQDSTTARVAWSDGLKISPASALGLKMKKELARLKP
jgi:tetratricopeptide (TPR) repeat protein